MADAITLENVEAPILTTGPSNWTKSAFGVGAVATGVIETGFNYFLLLFYSQVIGLDARLVSLALLVSLLIDAIADPIVGYWSDNFRSRLGRRHPFMYAAAVPAGLSWAMLWMPPHQLGGQGIFWYLLILSILIRLFVTLYETPSSALTPELSYDYDERASLQGIRYFFGWAGPNLMTVIMFALVFPAFATALIANGQFNRDAYVTYGILGGLSVFAAILICAAGTQSRVRHMSAAPAKRSTNLREIFAEVRHTLADRSFFSLFVGTMLGAVATGLSASLAFYFTTFFWEFTSQQIGIITIGIFVSAALGAGIAPMVSRRLGKKRGAMAIGIIAFVGAPLPILLRLFGVMPPNGDPSVFWIVLITNTLDTGLVICFQILTSAMIADLVDRAELRTGRRSEGVFFAAITFIRKSVLGLGLVVASLVLALAEFPAGATAGHVKADVLWRLGAWYVPIILGLWLTMMAVIATYRLDRAEHEDNLRKLAETRPGPALTIMD